MQPSAPTEISKPSLWTGRALSTLAVLFMLMDAGMKIVHPAFVLQVNAQLGFPASTLLGIGLVLLAFTVLYVVPRTSILGAILLTGFLGGAVASKVRIEAPTFDIAFPLLFAALLWTGLWLRDPRTRTLLAPTN
jgi:hypothetical protein